MQLATLEDQRRHYAAVRRRLAQAGQSPQEVGAARLRILRMKQAALEAEREKLRARQEEEKRTLSLLAQYRLAVDTMTTSPARAYIKLDAAVFRLLMVEIADRHGVLVSDMMGPSRKAALAMARAEFCYEAKVRFPKWSCMAIARMFGGRDHSSIVHAIRRWAERNNLPLPGAESSDD